jgi:hypothetical protein
MIYELRTYIANEGKMPALTDRFRKYTIPYFDKYGIQSIGYWTSNTPGEENHLIYLLGFKDKQQRESAWAGFMEDPQRKAVFAETEKNGKLVKQVLATVMTPTDFSAMK